MRSSTLITLPHPPTHAHTLSSKIHNNDISIDQNPNKNAMKYDQVGNNANNYSNIKTFT